MQLQKLTKTDEFSSVFSFKKRFYGAWLIINVMPNHQPQNRYGLVVPKRVAKRAVDRNYMKRVLRELARLDLKHAQGFDVILQVKTTFKPVDFLKVKQELMQLMQRVQKRGTQVHTTS